MTKYLRYLPTLLLLITCECSADNKEKFKCLKLSEMDDPKIGMHLEPYWLVDSSNESVSRMIKIIARRGFRRISTFPIDFSLNTVRKSIIDVAIEFNIDANRTVSIYPTISAKTTIFNNTIERVKSIIEGANNQYSGIIEGIIIYTQPSHAKKHLNILQDSVISSNWSVPVGVSVQNCLEDIQKAVENKTLGVLNHIGFIICIKNPDEQNDPTDEANKVIQYLEDVKTALGNANLNNVTVIGRTRWRSKWVVGGGSSGIEGRESLRRFWCQIEKKSAEFNISIQMFHAFERPKYERGGIKIPQSKLEPNYGWWLPVFDEDTGKIDFKEKVDYEEIPEIPLKEIVIGVVAGIVILVFSLAITILYYKLKLAKSLLSEKEIKEFQEGVTEVRTDANDHTEDALKLPYDKRFEIPKSSFYIDDSLLLGKGEFGLVYRGKVEGYDKELAIKKNTANISATSFKNMLSEIKIMIYVGKHPNIVSIVGAHTGDIRQGNVYIALEMCELGSLESFLKKFRAEFLQNKDIDAFVVPKRPSPFSPDNEPSARYTAGPTLIQRFAAASPQSIVAQLHKWAYGIANGMEYIASKHIIHSDLAARNVLLAGDKTVKITDFGLSHRLYDYTQYISESQGPLPWRWMAIEALEEMTFSTKTDVWSYGVTLYELFSLGLVPYPGYTYTLDFIREVKTGIIRIPKPEHATDEIYQLMSSCWAINPNNRPDFIMIKKILSQLVQAVDVNSYRDSFD